MSAASSETSNLALFGVTSDATIKNFVISSENGAGIAGAGSKVAAVVATVAREGYGWSGDAVETTLENVENQMNVSGSSNIAGLVACVSSSATLNVSSCYNAGTVSGTSDVQGGLVGRLESSVTAVNVVSSYNKTAAQIKTLYDDVFKGSSYAGKWAYDATIDADQPICYWQASGGSDTTQTAATPETPTISATAGTLADGKVEATVGAAVALKASDTEYSSGTGGELSTFIVATEAAAQEDPSGPSEPSAPEEPATAAGNVMHRLYNPNSGEHFYTASDYERDHLVSVGWKSEGIGWYGL